MKHSIEKMRRLLEELKSSSVKRVDNPNLLVPTIMALCDVIRKIEQGEMFEDQLAVVEHDLRLLALV